MSGEREQVKEAVLLQAMPLAAREAQKDLEELLAAFVRLGAAVRELVGAMTRDEVRAMTGRPYQVISSNRGEPVYIPLGRRQ